MKSEGLYTSLYNHRQVTTLSAPGGGKGVSFVFLRETSTTFSSTFSFSSFVETHTSAFFFLKFSFIKEETSQWLELSGGRPDLDPRGSSNVSGRSGK